MVYVVSNGTGGEIDSVWSSPERAEFRAESLNRDAHMTLGWAVWVKELRDG